MSRRHRDSGRAVTTKDDRLAEHRRDRRAARQKITVAEPDDAVLPGEGHTHLHAHRPTAIERKPPRHWKLPFWKRRNAMRSRRVMAERLLAQQE